MSPDSDSAPAGNGSNTGEQGDDPSLEALREILLSSYRQRLFELEAELNDMEQRINNKDTFIAMVVPVLGDAIRRKIRDARSEMIDALYPIIGQMVVRAVSEAMRDLARSIDAQMRTSFDVGRLGRRLEARARGVSSAEMLLRESLPFQVAEVFLIHRESGLLLWHISRDPEGSPDSDIISGMLTAIRDFTQESFGQDVEGQLDEIQYGDRRILLETARYAYLAVVVDGIEPPGFRADMRERVIEVNVSHENVLRDYDGDPSPLRPVDIPLRSLLMTVNPNRLSSGQKAFLLGALVMLSGCLLAFGLAGTWAWQITHPSPTPAPVVMIPTATSTPTPTATFTSTPTPTFTATATPTFTPTPTFTATPVMGLMTGNVWIRADASDDSTRLGVILNPGQAVEILGVSGEWYQIRWSPPGEAEVIGWVPSRWVGTFDPIPERIVTPTSNP